MKRFSEKHRNSSKLFFLLVIITLLTVMIICLSYTGITVEKREATRGYMDLVSENFLEKVVKLDGEWEIYPDLLKNEDFRADDYIQVPGSWGKTEIKKEAIKKQTFLTYRLKLKLPKPDQYCLKLQFVSSAYRVFINGEQVCENGKVGVSKEEERASWKNRLIPFFSEGKEVELIIQVSNYHCTNGGMMRSILLSTQSTLYDYETLNVIKSALFIGMFIGIGFYLILLNQSMHNRYNYTYLGMFCMASMLLGTIIDGGILFYIFPKLPLGMAIKIEYLAYMVQVIAMQQFIWNMYPNLYHKQFYRIIRAINLIYVGLILVTSNLTVVYSKPVYISVLLVNFICYLILIIKAIIVKRKYAYTLLIGSCMMYLGCIIEILNSQFYFKEPIFNNNFYILGVLIFLICQSYVLASTVDEAFIQSKHAKDMEIAFLQAQISPHFFFNILNNVYYLIHINAEQAKKLLYSFCQFLRVKYKFDYRKAVFYSLKEELELVEAYVNLEKNRLNGLLELTIEVDEMLLQTSVLPLIIQPLVENAIKHGFKSTLMHIHITIEKKDKEIHFKIKDNGKGMSQDRMIQVIRGEELDAGIGLKNVNYRLSKCYHTQLIINSRLEEGTEVAFNLPLEVQDESGYCR